MHEQTNELTNGQTNILTRQPTTKASPIPATTRNYQGLHWSFQAEFHSAALRRQSKVMGLRQMPEACTVARKNRLRHAGGCNAEGDDDDDDDDDSEHDGVWDHRADSDDDNGDGIDDYGDDMDDDDDYHDDGVDEDDDNHHDWGRDDDEHSDDNDDGDIGVLAPTCCRAVGAGGIPSEVLDFRRCLGLRCSVAPRQAASPQWSLP